MYRRASPKLLSKYVNVGWLTFTLVVITSYTKACSSLGSLVPELELKRTGKKLYLIKPIGSRIEAREQNNELNQTYWFPYRSERAE